MSASMKLLVLVICLNTFLYLGVNFVMYENLPVGEKPALIQGDLFDLMLSDRSNLDSSLTSYSQSLNSSANYSSTYNFNLSRDFAIEPRPSAGSDSTAASGAVGFWDGLKMVSAFLTTLWRIAIAPITIFSYNLFPPLVALIIGLPLVLLEVFAVIVLFRGGGAT